MAKRNTKITKNLLRLKGSMTLQAFSNKCGIGSSTMHNYLHGRDLPSREIVKICTALSCSADWLIGLKKEGKSGDAEIKLAGILQEIEADVKEKQELIKRYKRTLPVKHEPCCSLKDNGGCEYSKGDGAGCKLVDAGQVCDRKHLWIDGLQKNNN